MIVESQNKSNRHYEFTTKKFCFVLKIDLLFCLSPEGHPLLTTKSKLAIFWVMDSYHGVSFSRFIKVWNRYTSFFSAFPERICGKVVFNVATYLKIVNIRKDQFIILTIFKWLVTFHANCPENYLDITKHHQIRNVTKCHHFGDFFLIFTLCCTETNTQTKTRVEIQIRRAVFNDLGKQPSLYKGQSHFAVFTTIEQLWPCSLLYGGPIFKFWLRILAIGQPK